jgi:hypothetical protein
MTTDSKEYAKAKAKMFIMGIPFRPMEENDFIGYQGADEECLIGFPSDDVTLIYSPSSKEIYEIFGDSDERVWKNINLGGIYQ